MCLSPQALYREMSSRKTEVEKEKEREREKARVEKIQQVSSLLRQLETKLILTRTTEPTVLVFTHVLCSYRVVFRWWSATRTAACSTLGRARRSDATGPPTPQYPSLWSQAQTSRTRRSLRPSWCVGSLALFLCNSGGLEACSCCAVMYGNRSCLSLNALAWRMAITGGWRGVAEGLHALLQLAHIRGEILAMEP